MKTASLENEARSGGDRPFRPGVVFKNGKLYVFTDRGVTVFRGGACPRAWRKTVDRPEWRGCRPDMDLRGWARAARRVWRDPPPRERAGPGLVEGDGQLWLPFVTMEHIRREWHSEAFASFLSTLPGPAWRLASRFPARQWHVLSLVVRSREAYELARSNPALAFALSSSWVFHRPPVAHPLREARRMARRKRRTVAAWLGFPDAEWAVRILGKVALPGVTIPGLLALRGCLPDPRVRGLLAHAGRVSAPALRFVTDPDLRPHVAPTLLDDHARDHSLCHFYMARDCLTMAGLVGHEPRRLRFRSRQQIAAVHDRFAGKMNEEGFRQRTALPSPPYEGTDAIVPISDSEGLLEEGRSQANCVASYLHEVLMRRSYIYRVLSPERATLELRNFGRCWGIMQLRAAGNRPVGRSTREAVTRWYDSVRPPGAGFVVS